MSTGSSPQLVVDTATGEVVQQLAYGERGMQFNVGMPRWLQ